MTLSNTYTRYPFPSLMSLEHQVQRSRITSSTASVFSSYVRRPLHLQYTADDL